MLCPRGRAVLLLLSALLSSVLADYYIDDTNTSLTYSSGPKAAWAPYAIGAEILELLLPNGTYQVIDASVCYNYTYRYAACFDTDSCLLTVPFTGSGITLYVYQAGPVGINASINIDGAHNQTNVLAASPAPAYEIANVSMFNVQQLPSGPHMLSLLINDLSGSYSGMMFDYVYVNESLVANSSATMTTTTATTATNTVASTSAFVNSTSGSHNDTAAIIGGVIGIFAVIVVGTLAFLWIRRHRGHTPEMIDLRAGSPSPLYPHTAYDPPFQTTGTYSPYAGYDSVPTNGSDLAASRSTEFSASMPLVPNRLRSADVRRTASAQSGDSGALTPFTATSGANSSSGPQSHKSRLVPSDDSESVPVTQPYVGHSPSGSRQDTSPLLTDEQADFINSLHRNNVPAAAIARVVERMLADGHADIREWERETRLTRSNTMTTAPPSYDFVAERG